MIEKWNYMNEWMRIQHVIDNKLSLLVQDNLQVITSKTADTAKQTIDPVIHDQLPVLKKSI